jgi:Protein of unknown function (DUF2680)
MTAETYGKTRRYVMKKIVVVAVLLGVVSALGLGATLALAQGPTPAQPTVPGWGPGWMRGGLGFGFNADWNAQMQTAVAQALGMTLDELNAQLDAGKTIVQIAQSKNIDLTKLHDAIQAAHEAIIQQAVKDGTLTQAQADWMLQRMDAMDQYWEQNSGTRPGLATGAGLGPGLATGAGLGPGFMSGAFGPSAGFRGGMMSRFWTQPTTQ